MAWSQFAVLNAVLIRLIFACLARSIRFKNLTKQTNFIMITIFYMNLVNYFFVYLFAPMDSDDSRIDLFKTIFGGLYTDFNAYWFEDIG